MRLGGSPASDGPLLNGTGSLYSPFPSSGISDQLKQGVGIMSRCDLPKPKLWASSVDQWALEG